MGVTVRYATVWCGGVWVREMNVGLSVIHWVGTLCYDRVVDMVG